jgi:hypothetical protein
MNKWTPRWRGMSRFVLLSTILIAAGHTHAATVPVTGYIVVNPIDVCNTTGPSGTTGCAPFNTQSLSPNPAQATTTTPIGFVDPATNVNITRAIWLQTGIDITFLPIQEYNNSNYQNIDDVSCTESTCTGPLTSTLFKQLSTPGAALKATGCKSNCTVPLASSKANAINMFFVNTINGSFGTGGVGVLSGFAWLNGNGVAVASNVFFPSIGQFPRFDTLAHELGHNLNLDHGTFGAGSVCSGVSSPGGCNVMDAGTVNGAPFRVIPTSSGCSTSSGALFDLDTSLCGTSVPTVPQADQLILGNATNTQQSEALLTGFLNPIPNVNATAGGGDVSFTVDFPKLKTAGGRNGEYIFALVLALPQGFQFGPNIFVETGGTAQVFGFEQLNGNNGQGNTNCLKPLNGGPSIQCLEIDFVPGTFTANTSISFTSDIINKSTGAEATLADLACTPPSPSGCLDLTYVFSDLLATSSAFAVRDRSGDLTANSQLPDAGVSSTIVDPSNFPSVANLGLTLGGFTEVACTPATATMCPSFAGGSWKNTGE